MVEASALSLTLGGKKILQKISFTLEAAQITVLLGPNGSGKSSLLRILAGLQRPSAGLVRVGNQNLFDLDPLERARLRGWMGSDVPASIPFSVGEVILAGAFPLEGRWVEPGPGAREKVEGLCAEVALGEGEPGFLDRDYPSLSQGERQLVHLVRVLYQHPPFMVLDEPTSALDLRHKVLVRQALKKRAAWGSSLVVTLHDFNEASALGSQALVLARGELCAAGNLRTILSGELVHRVWGVHGGWTEEGLFCYDGGAEG